MWTLLFGVTFGLLASSRSEPAQAVKSRSCSHAGVFHVEGLARYTLTFDLAKELCESLETTLADVDQVAEAHDQGLETCRYGWISNQSTAILRHKAHVNCANNMTGIFYHNDSPDYKFDAYCYDAGAGAEKNCEKLFNPESMELLEDHMVSDGTAATTEQPEEDLSEKKTDIQIQTVDVEDQVEPESTGQPEVSANPAASADPDTQNFTSAPRQEAEDSTTEPELIPVPRTEDSATPASTAASPEEPPEGGEATERPAEVEEAVEGIKTLGTGPTVLLPEIDDTTGSGMSPSEAEDKATTATPVGEPAETQISEVVDVMVEDVETNNRAAPPPPPKAGADTMGPGETAQQSGSSNWLVIVGVIVAVGAILLVCAAVAKRKSWCSQRQTLMISHSKEGGEGNGAAASAVASSRAQEREQEMVTLMNKEKIQENGNTEEFTVITLEESPEKGPLA